MAPVITAKEKTCLIRVSWLISSELHLRCWNEEPLNEANPEEPGVLQELIETEESQPDFTYADSVYDNEDILLELDGSNNITARYTHGPGIDEPLIMEKGGASFFYHADGLGSITELTDVNGSVVKSYAYSSFGRVESETNPTFLQPYTFTGRELDPETGLHFYRNRTLDPFTGRFSQEDPFEGSQFRPQTLNRYPYVSNNPVRKIDPFGLQEETAGTCPPRRNCLRDYFKCLSNCVVAPNISIPTLVAEAGPAAEYFYTAEAWAHAASKNLIYPNKSSTFRLIMRNARAAGLTFALVALNYCIYVECLVDELKCESLF